MLVNIPYMEPMGHEPLQLMTVYSQCSKHPNWFTTYTSSVCLSFQLVPADDLSMNSSVTSQFESLNRIWDLTNGIVGLTAEIPLKDGCHLRNPFGMLAISQFTTLLCFRVTGSTMNFDWVLDFQIWEFQIEPFPKFNISPKKNKTPFILKAIYEKW